MKTFTGNQIEKEIVAGFGKTYKAFGGFADSGELWDACIAAVHDAELMNNIIFCNDVHQIPPVHTFLKVLNRQCDLTEFEKRSVGAFWGFVFKFVFRYRNQQSVTARVNTVRTATYFFDSSERISVQNKKAKS